MYSEAPDSDPATRPYDEIWELDHELAAEFVHLSEAHGEFDFHGMRISVANPAVNWSGGNRSRSQQLALHQWHHLEPFLIHHSRTKCDRCLSICSMHMRHWLAGYDQPNWQIDDDTESFVAYGTAVARRLYRLAYVIASAGSDSVLEAGLRRHVEWLQNDVHFLAHNNHGVIQSVCQILAATRLPHLTDADFLRQGVSRLHALLQHQFSAKEGIHLEHSPGYHLMVTRLLTALLPIDGILTPHEKRLIRRALIACRWMTMATGELADLGDSERRCPYVRLLLSPREFAKPQKPLLRACSESGYVFIKGTSMGRETYFAHTAAFHSRAHKQADTGTFIWRDRGSDILIDTGLFDYEGREPVGSAQFRDGFRYSHPMRVWVESTKAHNTIEVNGNNHPRYRSRPFGSAIRAVARSGELFVMESAVPNLPKVTHYRLLLLMPARWLICLDVLRSRSEGYSLKARQWFQLSPTLAIKRVSCGVDGTGPAGLKLETADGTALEVAAMSHLRLERLVSGDKIDSGAAGRAGAWEGWWSPQRRVAEPCSSFALSAEGTRVTLATLFHFGKLHHRAPVAVCNATGRAWRLEWWDHECQHRVRVQRDGRGMLKAQYSAEQASHRQPPCAASIVH